MEPPSKQLVSQLTGMGLCTLRDLRKCRGRVRRLARDLPSFDSIWIDALVQARRLTKYQAQVLESDDPLRLKVGPCIIIERLGTTERSATFLAEIRERHQRCVLKQLHVPADQIDHAWDDLNTLVQRLSQVTHPSIAGPFTAQRQDEQLYMLSPHIPGPHLGELLIRRGRFPHEVVGAIARQLLDGLSLLEKTGCVHGDIILSNVRCANSGRMVLVDTGINPIVHPRISYYDDAPPERYEGTAPELIGPGRKPDAASDIYALGCLLWQLLTARPPYIQADPLLKLTAHQTQMIEDVRVWVPDAPAYLAEAINRCVARRREDRPQSFHDARALFGATLRGDAQRLKAFRSTFQSRAIPLSNHSQQKPGRWAWTTAAILLISGFATSLFHSGVRNELLSLAKRGQPVESVAPVSIDPSNAVVEQQNPPESASRRRWETLPVPNASGVIQLDSQGPFEAEEITQVGSLSIMASPDRPATIIVDRRPFVAACDSLHIENVIFRFRDEVDAGVDSTDVADQASALLLVQSQEFSASGCRFISDAGLPDDKKSIALKGSDENGIPDNSDHNQSRVEFARPAIGWKLVDASDPQGGTLKLHSCVFQGAGAGVYLKDIPHTLTAVNVLKQGAGAFLQLKSMPSSRQRFDLQIKNMTARESGPMIRVMLSDAQSRRLAESIHCVAEDSVFDFARAAGKPRASFVEFVENELSSKWHERIELTGQGNLTNPGVVMAALRSPDGKTWGPLDDSRMSVEGLSIAEIRFLGEAMNTIEDCLIEPPSIPSLSSLPPGIDVERMPLWMRGE